MRAVRAEVEEVRTKWASYRNSPSVNFGTTTSTNTIQVPKPSTYSYNRKAMEVENFLFGLKQYLEAKGHGDTINPIHTWDDFKRELNKQFSPTNAEKEAHGCLYRLKQSGSISDYIKEFTTLIFEIEDMSDKDKLFYFMDDLKDWVRVELERRNVQDLDTAIAAVKSLADYTQPKERKVIHEKSG
ncbi:hypothetical protein EZV62_024306 [Acer yangbiense]|uniref:Retrotransposon gag domain-containing protein n=1 Tax=Acer yangbiense TaxID=1000413 RepID=A0A5C7H5T4_9ROSI|nr:hypothetical protein EZV62_024306 [Acer yangbiense]